MGLMPYHVRLAELFVKQRKDVLTDADVLEMTHCLTANAKYCWDLMKLYNLSYAAYTTEDWEWLHSICKQIDDLETKQVDCAYVPPKKKKPGRKGPTE